MAFFPLPRSKPVYSRISARILLELQDKIISFAKELEETDSIDVGGNYVESNERVYRLAPRRQLSDSKDEVAATAERGAHA